MSIAIPGGYLLPFGSRPLSHARIVHARNWKAGGTVAASTTAAGYVDTGPTGSNTFERWKPTALTATWEYNHGSATTVDCCCVAAHTFGTNGNTVAVQYWNGSSWVTVATLAFTDNGPAMFIFTPVSAQRWRLSISGGTAPEVGVVRFAQALQMERPMYGGHTPVDFGRVTELRANYSETNEILGRTKQRSRLETSYAWSNLTEAWINANWKTFQQAIEEEPFFIAWRPSQSQMVAYALVDELPIPQTMGLRDFYSVELACRAYAYD